MKRQRKRLYLIKTRGLSVLTDSPFSTDFDYKIVFFDFSAGELWNPNSICIHPEVIRRIAVCIHCAGGGIQIVVQAVYLYPAGCHVAVCVKIIPLAVYILPLGCRICLLYTSRSCCRGREFFRICRFCRRCDQVYQGWSLLSGFQGKRCV